MSAYEGSSMQEEWERRAEARHQRLARIQRENPSLTPDEAQRWLAKLEADEEAAAARRARCCKCQGPQRAEVVNVGGALGVCRCDCHGTHKRGG